MKVKIKNYEAPEVELMEVYVEKGFGGSPDTDGGNSDGGTGSYTPGEDEGI